MEISCKLPQCLEMEILSSLPVKSLPQCLEIEILSSLPVKSLLRFKCVCKFWYALIMSTTFITKHLHLGHSQAHNLIHNHSSLLVLRNHNMLYRCFATLLSSKTLQVFAEIDLKPTDFAQVVNSCNGLICIWDTNTTIHIMNPATRMIRSIQIPPYVTGSPHVEASTFDFAFGFDPKINEYKVVRIIRVLDYNWFRGLPEVVQVCTLRNSESWRKIELIPPAIISSSRKLKAYKNGVCYWIAYDSQGSVILSFDISNEVFGTTRILDFMLEDHCCDLAMLNGSIGIIRYPDNITTGGVMITSMYFEIWVMTQSCVEELWTKQVTVGPFSGVEKPLAIWKNNVLFLESSEGELISCDLNTHEVKYLNVYGVPNKMQVIVYDETLVSA